MLGSAFYSHMERNYMIALFYYVRGNKTSFVSPHFTDVPVASQQSAKYIGLTIRQDLKWKRHVNNVFTMANKTFGFLCRTYTLTPVRPPFEDKNH